MYAGDTSWRRPDNSRFETTPPPSKKQAQFPGQPQNTVVHLRFTIYDLQNSASGAREAAKQMRRDVMEPCAGVILLGQVVGHTFSELARGSDF